MEENTAYVTTPDGLKLFYRFLVPEKPRAVVLIIHGYAEHSGRYAWVMQTLGEHGIAVFAPDVRGHGRSARVLADLDSADKVVEDIRTLHAEVAEQVPGAPFFLLGHSLGSTLTLLYSLRYPQGVGGLILSAPFVQLPDYASPFLVAIAGLMAGIFPLLPVQSFNYTKVSRDPEVIRRLEEDPLYYKGKIRARTGHQMLTAIKKVKKELDKVHLPLLALYGTADKTVNTSDSQYLAWHVSSSDKTVESFPGLYHEILNEPEKKQVIERIIDWINERV